MSFKTKKEKKPKKEKQPQQYDFITRMKRRTYRFFIKMQEPYYQGRGAEVAFYLLFSVVPVFIMLTSVLGALHFSTDIITSIASNYFSPEQTEKISQFLTVQPSSKVTVVYIIILVWAASKAQFSLTRISNYAYGLANDMKGSWAYARARSIITELILVAVIVAVLIILVFGESIVSVIQSVLLHVFNINAHLNEYWFYIRWPVALIAMIFTLTFNYAAMPSTKFRLFRHLPGAIFTAAAVLIASLIYQLYLNHFSNFEVLYGSLSTLIALLLWFYIVGYIMILGILLNKAWFEPEPDSPDFDMEYMTMREYIRFMLGDVLEKIKGNGKVDPDVNSRVQKFLTARKMKDLTEDHYDRKKKHRDDFRNRRK